MIKPLSQPLTWKSEGHWDKSLPGKEQSRWCSAWIRLEPSLRSASACSAGCTGTGFYWPSALHSPWWLYVTGGKAQNSRGSTRPHRCWSRYSGGQTGGHTCHKYLIIWKYIIMSWNLWIFNDLWCGINWCTKFVMFCIKAIQEYVFINILLLKKVFNIIFLNYSYCNFKILIFIQVEPCPISKWYIILIF